MHPWLTKEYYISAHERYDCFPASLAALCGEAERLQTVPAEAEAFLDLAQQLSTAQTKEELPPLIAARNMTYGLAVAANVPAMMEGLLQDGFPAEVVRHTALEIDTVMMERPETPGFGGHLVGWFLKFLRRLIVRIARFNFERRDRFLGRIKVYENAAGELLTFSHDLGITATGDGALNGEGEVFHPMVTEAEGKITGYPVVGGKTQRTPVAVPASEWKLRLAYGDPALAMHIPDNEPFTPEIMAASYEKGIALLRNCWSDLHPRAVTCKSWLLDPQLRELLRPGSNILAFQAPYTVFPTRSSNCTSALECVFGEVPENLQDAPEDTSLRRNLKAFYLSGKKIWFTHGYWLYPGL